MHELENSMQQCGVHPCWRQGRGFARAALGMGERLTQYCCSWAVTPKQQPAMASACWACCYFISSACMVHASSEL